MTQQMTEKDLDRLENYRYFHLSGDIHAVAAGSGVERTAFWNVLRFLHETAEYYRDRIDSYAWWFRHDQELYNQAVAAASSDKLGECLATLMRLQDLRKSALERMKTFLELRSKEVEQRTGASEKLSDAAEAPVAVDAPKKPYDELGRLRQLAELDLELSKTIAYKHKKSGRLYRFVTLSFDEASQTQYVVYEPISLEQSVWPPIRFHRPVDVFLDKMLPLVQVDPP